MADLNSIKEEFEKENFNKIRHQSIAHKNKLLDDPAGISNLYLKEDYIIKLGMIVKKLRINSYFWFDFELYNPEYKIICGLELLVNNFERQ